MRKPNNYQHLELDVDGYYYRFMDSDVQMFTRSKCSKIDDLLNTYRAKIEQTLYIIGNYLFFTYKGAKYWDIISHSVDEVIYVGYIKQDLVRLGCEDIVYDGGRSD